MGTTCHQVPVCGSQSALKTTGPGSSRVFCTSYAHFAHRGKELQYGISIKDKKREKKSV